MRQNILKQRLTALLLPLLATVEPAMAHTAAGSVDGFAAGFFHPLQGSDHLLTMLAVGLWAAALGGRALWLAPLSFVSLMAVGAVIQLQGFAWPQVEWMVSASVLAMGLTLWCDWRASPGMAALLVGIFAVSHGYAHAAEIGNGSDAIAYAGGFLMATAGLHVLGILTGMAGRKSRFISRAFGLVCASAGVVLLSGI